MQAQALHKRTTWYDTPFCSFSFFLRIFASLAARAACAPAREERVRAMRASATATATAAHPLLGNDSVGNRVLRGLHRLQLSSLLQTLLPRGLRLLRRARDRRSPVDRKKSAKLSTPARRLAMRRCTHLVVSGFFHFRTLPISTRASPPSKRAVGERSSHFETDLNYLFFTPTRRNFPSNLEGGRSAAWRALIFWQQFDSSRSSWGGALVDTH